MNFNRKTALKLTYTRAHGPDPDSEHAEYLSFPGGNVSPRLAYAELKGSALNMDWPQGSALVPFDAFFPAGNNLLTDGLGDKYGVRGWQITAEPGHISGKLQVASYLDTNSDDTAPDSVDSYDLGPSGWTSGDLRIFTGSFSGAYYRTPRFRFIPGPLVATLGI